MKSAAAALLTFGTVLVAAFVLTPLQSVRAASPAWNARAAAAYLDDRQEWWQHWPNAARDHDTQCVSCHTALPYALARPALRRALGERELAAPERLMIANVVKRVTLWKDVEPFYPDQTRGLPKTSESRGTESISVTSKYGADRFICSLLNGGSKRPVINPMAYPAANAPAAVVRYPTVLS